MTDLIWADARDGEITPPGPLLITMSRSVRARSREISERHQRAYDESDALEARYEELRGMFETAGALRAADGTAPGRRQPLARLSPGKQFKAGHTDPNYQRSLH
jgi:hypothetical protein